MSLNVTGTRGRSISDNRCRQEQPVEETWPAAAVIRLAKRINTIWRGRPHLKVYREVVAVEQALAGAQQRRRQRHLARGRAPARRVRPLPAVGPEQHHARACAARTRVVLPCAYPGHAAEQIGM